MYRYLSDPRVIFMIVIWLNRKLREARADSCEYKAMEDNLNLQEVIIPVVCCILQKP